MRYGVPMRHLWMWRAAMPAWPALSTRSPAPWRRRYPIPDGDIFYAGLLVLDSRPDQGRDRLPLLSDDGRQEGRRQQTLWVDLLLRGGCYGE